MTKSDFNRELDFSEDELSEMNAELARENALGSGAAARKKKSALRVPVDIVPRREASDAIEEGIEVAPAPTTSDLIVEAALAGREASGPLSIAQEGDGAVSAPMSMQGSIPDAATAGMGGDDLDLEVTIDPVGLSLSETVQRVFIASPLTGGGRELREDETPVQTHPLPDTKPLPIMAATADVERSPQPILPSVTAPLPVDIPARKPTTAPGSGPQAPTSPVDLIAAALVAPRPPVLTTRAQEAYEEELSGEEIEVVSESQVQVPARAPAQPSASVRGSAALASTPPPLPIGSVVTPPPPEMVAGALLSETTPPPMTPLASVAPTSATPPALPAASAPVVAAAPASVPAQPPPAPEAPAGGEEAARARTRRKRRAKAWFEEVFDEDYLRTLPFMTARQTHREADFIESSLDVPKGGHLLDLGCGYGRHALELAARGYHVVGVDLSLPLLIRAADEAQRRGLNVNFVHGDMRELSFELQFDAAYCVFTTFGYFDDDTNRKVAQRLAHALKPGGRILLDVLNRDYIIGDLPARVWWEGDGCVVLEEVDFNYYTSRILSRRSIVYEDGRQLEQEMSIRAYSLHELGKVLHHAGFRVTEVSGSLATRGRFFGASSRSLLVTAEKRAG